MKKLDLNNKSLVELSDCLLDPDLGDLDLKQNSLKDLPSLPITLKILDLSNNSFTNLPSCLKGLENLEHLHLSYNKLTTLKGLPKSLKELNVSHNLIKQVDPSLKSLKCLERLDLSDNHLTKLPPWLLGLPLKELQATGNHIRSDSIHEGSSALESLRDNYDGLESRFCFKLVVVGQPRAGKSSLIKALQMVIDSGPIKLSSERNKLKDRIQEELAKISSTVGVDVYRKPEEFLLDPEVECRVWDFSGLPEYESIQKLFLSDPNDIFVIVVDLSTSASSQREQLQRWFKLLASFIPKQRRNSAIDRIKVPQENSVCVIIVGTKLDTIRTKDREVEKQRLKQLIRQISVEEVLSPTQILFVSSREMEAIDEVRECLLKEVRTFADRKALVKIPRRFRILEEFVFEPTYKNRLFVDVETEFHHLMQTLSADQFLEYQQRIGILLYWKERGVICYDPELFSKIQAAFIPNTWHQRLLLTRSDRLRTSSPQKDNNTTTTDPYPLRAKALLSRSEFESILRHVSSKYGNTKLDLSPKNVDSILSHLQDFNLCLVTPSLFNPGVYSPGTILFPLLLPTGDVMDFSRFDDDDELNSTRDSYYYSGYLITPFAYNQFPCQFFPQFQVKFRQYLDRNHRVFSNGMVFHNSDFEDEHVIVEFKQEYLSEQKTVSQKIVMIGRRRGDKNLDLLDEIFDLMRTFCSKLAPGRELESKPLCPSCCQTSQPTHPLLNVDLTCPLCYQQFLPRSGPILIGSSPSQQVRFAANKTGGTGSELNRLIGRFSRTEGEGLRLFSEKEDKRFAQEFSEVRLLYEGLVGQADVPQIREILRISNTRLQAPFLLEFLRTRRDGLSTTTTSSSASDKAGILLNHVFENLVVQSTGNEFANVVGCWKVARSDEAGLLISNNNFHLDDEHPYLEFEQLSLTDLLQEENEDVNVYQYILGKKKQVLIFSLVIMGRIYPLTTNFCRESFVLPSSYDSAYLMSDNNKNNINNISSTLDFTPQNGRILVNRSNQVLPLFLVHLQDPQIPHLNQSDHSSSSSYLDLSVLSDEESDKNTRVRKLLLWFDNRAEDSNLKSQISSRTPGELLSFRKLQELTEWFENSRSVQDPSYWQQHVRILAFEHPLPGTPINNSKLLSPNVRTSNTSNVLNDSAGALLKWLKSPRVKSLKLSNESLLEPWALCPLLIFGPGSNCLQHLEDPRNLVWVSGDPEHAIKFCSFEKLARPPPKSMLLKKGPLLVEKKNGKSKLRHVTLTTCSLSYTTKLFIPHHVDLVDITVVIDEEIDQKKLFGFALEVQKGKNHRTLRMWSPSKHERDLWTEVIRARLN